MRDVGLECVPIGAGSCASALEVDMPLPSNIAPDYRWAHGSVKGAQDKIRLLCRA